MSSGLPSQDIGHCFSICCIFSVAPEIYSDSGIQKEEASRSVILSVRSGKIGVRKEHPGGLSYFQCSYKLSMLPLEA